MKNFFVKYKIPLSIILGVFILIELIQLCSGFYFPLNRDDWGMQTYEYQEERFGYNSQNKSGGIIMYYEGNEKSIVVPKYIDGEKIVCIDRYAFDYACDKIETIFIPEGIKEIGNRAFWGCDSLKTIYLPLSVTEISANSLQFNHTGVNIITFNPKILSIIND